MSGYLGSEVTALNLGECGLLKGSLMALVKVLRWKIMGSFHVVIQ